MELLRESSHVLEPGDQKDVGLWVSGFLKGTFEVLVYAEVWSPFFFLGGGPFWGLSGSQMEADLCSGVPYLETHPYGLGGCLG